MMPFIDYGLRVNLLLGLFYGCYWLLLRRHTYLRLNRAYLLGTLVGSLLLPLVPISGLPLDWLWPAKAPVAAVVSADAGYVVATAPDAPLRPDWPALAAWAWGLVALGLGLRTAWQIGRLFQRISQWPASRLSDHTLVTPPDAQTPTFSFFRFLVLNPADVQSEAIRQHELVHIRQGHSWDVLLAEVMQALCWPNPVLIGYRRALRRTHEFLADQYASAQFTTNRDDYARLLVNYAFNLPGNALTHPFQTEPAESPTLKQRIQMLYQPRTRTRALWTYALVLPLAALLMALTTSPTPTSSVASTPTDSTVSILVQGFVRDRQRKPLPGANVVVKNGTRGTTTDHQGRFSLNVPTGTTLVASFVGFNSEEMEVTAKKGNMVFSTVLKPMAVDGAATDDLAQQPQPPKRSASTKGNEVFTVVEQNPSFPGGQAALYAFIERTIHYPKEAMRRKAEGKVYVNFVVEADGTISRPTVLKGFDASCDREALRVVRAMPKWQPGMQNGQPVAVMYNLPIAFQLTRKARPSERTHDADAALIRLGTYDIELARPQFREAPVYPTYKLSSSEPLFIANGLEITRKELDQIDLKTIESINVMKGDQSALYGAKAKHGVVNIKLKAK